MAVLNNKPISIIFIEDKEIELLVYNILKTLNL